ncbi:hypothetical protein PaG_00151 [Moesziomyces aphidis]|uniref:Uncharacterized protein n=1 Tax=Moesziomyces aphidis TaxID=84754 RepID=W3VX65_MOEAP|nr:hypothetical protein PaG_00151 [Moesziomyces aphidis]
MRGPKAVAERATTRAVWPGEKVEESATGKRSWRVWVGTKRSERGEGRAGVGFGLRLQSRAAQRDVTVGAGQAGQAGRASQSGRRSTPSRGGHFHLGLSSRHDTFLHQSSPGVPSSRNIARTDIDAAPAPTPSTKNDFSGSTSAEQQPSHSAAMLFVPMSLRRSAAEETHDWHQHIVTTPCREAAAATPPQHKHTHTHSARAPGHGVASVLDCKLQEHYVCAVFSAAFQAVRGRHVHPAPPTSAS